MPKNQELARLVGARIKEAREERGVTQAELSRLVSVSQQSQVWKWEKGLAMPSVLNLFDICVAINVSPNELLCWDDLD